MKERCDWEHSDLSWVYNSTCVFLEVRVWFWHSAPSPLLPLVHCYKAQRRCSGWVLHTHTRAHTHTTRHSSVTQCHESHQCSGWVQFMSIMIELTRWIQPCVTELPPVRQMHTQTCRQKYQNNDHGSPFNSKLNVKLSGLGMSVQVQSP